ncbi:MAG: ABC transporter permease, partial [Phycisphaerales bacterium]
SSDLWAEALKTRRTLAFWLALGSPAFVTVMALLAGLGSSRPLFGAGEDGWSALAQGFTGLWSVMLLPLTATAVAALLAQVEHGNHALKHVFALPTPRWAVYFAKQFGVVLLLALASAGLFVGMLVVGMALELARPSVYAFEGGAPWGSLAWSALAPLIAALGIAAIMTWVSMRIANFVAPVSIGVLATFSALFLQGWKYGFLHPFLMPMYTRARPGPEFDGVWVDPLIASPVVFVVVAAVGCWEMTRRDVLR